MIATVFLDWGLAFGAGVLFAIFGRAELAGASSRLRTRAFRWGLIYLHAGVLTISITLYAINADWMWMYWVDPRVLPLGIVILTFALYEVCFLAGFLLTAELARGPAWVVAGATAAAITTLEIAARGRLFRFGTLNEFRSGIAEPAIAFGPLRVQPEWWLVGIAGGISLVALALMLRKLSRIASVRA